MRYSDVLMDHFLNPRFPGRMEDHTGRGRAKYPTCGDTCSIFLRVAGDVIERASFLAGGCGPGIACADVLCGMVTGRSLQDAAALTPADIAAALELPTPKTHTAELAVDALRAAIEDDRRRGLATDALCALIEAEGVKAP